jgi:glycosyltransferase involved in cell wall biosynthesis
MIKAPLPVKVSVIMSLFSEPEDWLRKAIYSILNQSFSDFEFIIINDNPKRKENDLLLKNFKQQDSRIVVVENKENIGLTKSLNIGLSLARGTYIARMDADDISFLTRLEKQYLFMEANPNIIACGTWARTIGKEKNINLNHYKTAPRDIANSIYFFAPFIHPTLFLRSSVLKKKNITYDESFLRAQDYRLAFELSKFGKLANIPEILINYRESKSQASNKYKNNQLDSAIRVRKMSIKYFFEQLNIKIDVPEKIDLNFVKELRKVELELKQTDGSISSDDIEIRFNMIRMISLLSLEKYSMKSCINFLFSLDYFKAPYSFKRFSIVIYKHMFPKTWLKFL